MDEAEYASLAVRDQFPNGLLTLHDEDPFCITSPL
jgi:hypothetical protein